MRQGFITAAAVAAGLLVFSAAQASDSSSGPRFGVVDATYVISNSHRAQQGRVMLQQLQQKLQGEVNDKTSKANALKEKIDKASAKSADMAKLQQDFQAAQRDVQQSVDSGRQELQQAQQQLTQSLTEEFSKVVNEYAKDNHYDLIFIKGQGTAYNEDSYEVTTGVMKAFDTDWDQLQKAAPAATKAAPAAATKH
ncbi:MAG TPA: OmpH family outer membrane protein [Gammaproteobacteria bacterium]|nr:OmpH family outer membrane protein [Gammaproteobacteria bacterium]